MVGEMSNDWARQEALKAVYRSVMVDPAFAALKKRGIHFVPGRGSMHPKVVFVGEAPGEVENRKRKPFVGPAGHVFHQLLEHVGLRREDVFVTNAVKYRPVVGQTVYRNRTPWPSEIKAARRHLRGELGVFRGVRVVTMGSTALKSLSGLLGASVLRCHGQPMDYVGVTDAPWFCLFHPARVLYDEDKRPELMRDMEAMARWLNG